MHSFMKLSLSSMAWFDEKWRLELHVPSPEELLDVKLNQTGEIYMKT